MIALAWSLVGGIGVLLVYTGLTPARPNTGPAPLRLRSPLRSRLVDRLGLEGEAPAQVAAAMAVFSTGAALFAAALFGGVLPAAVAAAVGVCLPVASLRARRQRRMSQARDAWPHLIEEIRLRTTSLGRSLPQALLEAGRRAPDELRPAFAAAEREWLLSTDFSQACRVLKDRLADPTADAVCETLLVAHEVGGTEIDKRLSALVDDRILDLESRRDAEARQAGVRFARRFVLIVPLGMALAGLSIGTGRAAYQTALGQALVACGIVCVLGCWLWAGRLMQLPEEERVFRG